MNTTWSTLKSGQLSSSLFAAVHVVNNDTRMTRTVAQVVFSTSWPWFSIQSYLLVMFCKLLMVPTTFTVPSLSSLSSTTVPVVQRVFFLTTAIATTTIVCTHGPTTFLFGVAGTAPKFFGTGFGSVPRQTSNVMFTTVVPIT